MEGRKKAGFKARGGFTYPEMAFLLFVLALFLAGTVWVSSGAISKSHPFGKSESVGREGEKAMDKIVALVSSGREFYYGKDVVKPSPLVFASESLDFLADLDGDASTGKYRISGVQGFERVFIARQGSSISAMVYSSPSSAPSTVRLTGDLASGVATPFEVTIGAATPNRGSEAPATGAPALLEVSRVDVRLTTGLKGSRLVVSRTVRPGGQPPLRQAP